MLSQRSAPSGSVASAYPALRPHASAHGFTDASFQPVFHNETSTQGSTIDGRTAAQLAGWARQVATGQVRLGDHLEAVRQLAREVTTLNVAKVSLIRGLSYQQALRLAQPALLEV